MALFVLIATHTSDQCPTANEKARKWFASDPAPMVALMKKLGIKPLVGPLVSTQHRTFLVVDAPKVEAVRDFIMQGGLVQWNSVEMINVIPQEEAIKEMATLTPIY
jgi:hypothetical protein